MESSEGISVAIRMRPLNERERSAMQLPIYRCNAQLNTISQLKDNNIVEAQTYKYDKVFDESISTPDVYDFVGR